MDPLLAFIRDRLAGVIADAAQGRTLAVVRALLGVSESASLGQIGAKVDALGAAPMNTGRLQLRDALDPLRGEADRTILLLDARRSFQEALGYAPAPPLHLSWTHLNLCVTSLALGNLRDARRSLSNAHLEAGRAAIQVPPFSFDRPTWVLPEIMPLVNELGAARRTWGDAATTAPEFIGYEADAGDLDRSVGDWRLWVNGYANTRSELRPARRLVVLELAEKFQVQQKSELLTALDEVDAGTKVHVRFLDDWIQSQHV